jgi:uncharacterized protein
MSNDLLDAGSGPALPAAIDVFALAVARGVVRGRLALAALHRAPDALLAHEGSIDVTWTGGPDAQRRPAGVLHMAGDLTLRCDRCQGALAWRLDESRPFWFVRTEAELARLPVDESPDEPLLGSARFDLAELVEDELILSVPLSPRHAACPLDAVEGGRVGAERGTSAVARPGAERGVAPAEDTVRADPDGAPGATAVDGASATAGAGDGAADGSKARTHRPFEVLGRWRGRTPS